MCFDLKGRAVAAMQLDFNDGTLPFHRRTNGAQPSLPMVVLPQNHRKTIDPNGYPQPFHSMVMVTLKTIESLRW